MSSGTCCDLNHFLVHSGPGPYEGGPPLFQDLPWKRGSKGPCAPQPGVANSLDLFAYLLRWVDPICQRH